MYYQYWGLKKPPFDNVPDPSMYVDCHDSMENAMAETLFAIQEGDECIAVIVGDVGLGKTMSLRMIIDSLDQEKYKIVLITNPGISFVQILQEIIGQLTGSQCEEKRKVNLLEIFNRQLFATYAEGKKILIFIDEANAISPMNLENLRLLTNMQDDRKNLFTMVLAGQNEFGRRLEHPKRANLFQRVGTYSKIERLGTAAQVKKYVETRLRLAGTTTKVFSDDAFGVLWEQADQGVPRLINKISKLCLKAGETNRFEMITGEVVEQIGSRFHRLAGSAVQKRGSRRPAQEEIHPERAEWEAEAEALVQPRVDNRGPAVTTAEEAPSASPVGLETAEIADDAANLELGADATNVVSETVLENQEIVMPQTERIDDSAMAGRTEEAETMSVSQDLLTEREEETDSGATYRAAEEAALPEEAKGPIEGPAGMEQDSEAEMSIGQVKIKIQLPVELMKRSLASSQEYRLKLAGGLAAETLKKHYQLIASQVADPVPVWIEIRDFVLDRMTREDTGSSGHHAIPQ